MAAPQFDPPLPTSSFFNIYNDAEPLRKPVNLPAGGCNYVDLTPGANGAKCGCRRFWSRFAAGKAYTDNLGSDHSAWCMCSHHACFHDDDRVPEAPTSARPTFGQENEKPKGAREPLSPVFQEASFRPTTGLPDPMDFLNQDAFFATSPRPRPGEQKRRQANPPSQQASSGLPDTLSWGVPGQSQPTNSALPPIPPQCLIPSQISSTASSQSRYLRPFAGKGLRTLSGAVQCTPRSPIRGKSQDAQAAAATVAQHDDAGGDRTMLEADNPSPSVANTPRATQSPIVEDRPASDIFGGPSRQTFRHLSDTVQGHEQRLDRLENVSFSAGGHDECHEKYDSADLRLTDLEMRVDEVEKLLNDTSSNGPARRVRRPGVDESTSSVVSVSTNATSRAAESSEVFSHLQSLQSQILQLQSYMPSYMHAWEVEVVFLPFPLRRVWQERYDFKTELSFHMDEWTQLPNTLSAATMRAQSPFCGEWAGAGQDQDWLLPRACGPRSIIDKRLRSRGLVRKISVKGPDARSVQAAMHAAFGDALSDMAAPVAPLPASRRRSVDGKIARFLGLQNAWVPLRKIHKDSRLRFLAPAEMVTPAIWDVAFLNSVVMRSSEPRLFVTHPEAYLQDTHAFDSGWTWQKIRELSRVYPDSAHPSHEVPEADALEDYWNWNDLLDEPVSAQSSLELRQARQRISLSPSQRFFTLKSSLRSSPSPFVSRRQTPSARERHVSRPLIRTTSMPPSAPKSSSPYIAKRRVTSHGQQQNETGPVQDHTVSSPPAAAAFKRRRTRSPSRPRNTPRWTASPSPALAGFVTDQWPPHQSRGVTPIYYATPFSNAPQPEVRPQRNPASGDDDSSDEHDEEGDHHIGSTDPHDHGDRYSHFDGDARAQHIRALVEHRRDSLQPRQLQPEDEPWPGIEDLDHVSDGENIDPLFSPAAADDDDDGDDDDATSVASSQPSEYPSTSRGWELPDVDHGMDFEIHEDDDRS